MTVVTTTYSPPNGAEVGLSGKWTIGTGGCWSTSAVGYIYTSGASYSAMIANASIAVAIDDSGDYRFFPIYQTTWNDSVPGSWDGSGWTGTSMYRHDFYVSQGLLSGTSHAWYYAPIHSLGTIKNISINTDSPSDTIGLPGATDLSTLAFDVEGCVTTIKVGGSFFGVTSVTSPKISAIKNLMTGNQFGGNPCTFFWNGELGKSGESMPYNVNVKDFTFKRSEKDVNRIDYDLTMIRRTIFI